jgi:hypothetical protein
MQEGILATHEVAAPGAAGAVVLPPKTVMHRGR